MTIRRKVVTLDDLIPDGVRIVVDWDNLCPGGSIFIPCKDVTRGKREILAIAARKNIPLVVRTRIHDGFLGLRVWRTM